VGMSGIPVNLTDQPLAPSVRVPGGTGIERRSDMGEFEFEVDWETLSREGIWHSIGQELAERGIHKNRFSDYSVKVLVTVYYDIKR